MKTLFFTSHLVSCVCLLVGVIQGEELHTWTDNSGNFTLQAKLINFSDTVVNLKREDGRTLAVPMEKLCLDDQVFLAQVVHKKAKEPAWEENILKALQQKTRMDFVRTPLVEVAAYLSNLHQIPIHCDANELDNYGLNGDEPITYKGHPVSLQRNLELMLKELELSWTLRDGGLIITTSEAANVEMVPYIYLSLLDVSADAVIESVTRRLEPDSWEDVGGPAGIESLSKKVFIISQSHQVHLTIQNDFKDALQLIRLSDLQGNLPEDKFLSSKVTSSFIETPLNDAIKLLQEKHQFVAHLDKQELEALGLTLSEPVTFDFEKIELRHALNYMLKPLDLSWSYDGKLVTISSQAAEELTLQRKRYDLTNLKQYDQDQLIQTLQSTVSPVEWDIVGGAGSMGIGLRGKLEVNARYQVQVQIAQLLTELESVNP